MATSLFPDIVIADNKDQYSQKDAEESYYAYKETKDIKYAIEFAERIRSQFVNMVDINFEDTSFLTLMLHDGKTIFDKMKENRVKFSLNALASAAYHTDIIKLLIDNDYTAIVGFIGEETLFSKIDGNQTVFDYILSHGCLTQNVIRNITSNHLEVIPRVVEYDKIYITAFNEDIMFSATYEGKRLIDYALDEKLYDFVNIKSIIHHPEIVDLLIEHDRSDLLYYLHEVLLCERKGNSTVLDFLLKKGIKPYCTYTRIENIKVLLENNEADSLAKLGESILISDLEPGKTVLEAVLERNITPRLDGYTQKKSLEVLSKLKRYDLMCRANVQLLLLPKTLNETYLEQILNNINYKKDNSLIYLSTFGLSINDRTKFLMTMARHDLMEYITPVTTEELLRKVDGQCLLDALLDTDIDLTVNRIIPEEVNDIDIALHLRLRGIEKENFNINLSSEGYVKEYYDEYNERFTHLSMDEESRLLLSALYHSMRFGGRCDLETLDLMMKSYEFMLHTNNFDAKEEIKRVIELKRGEPTFGVVEAKGEGSHYCKMDNQVHMDEHSIGCFNHEITHAFFSNFTDEQTPRDFIKILFNLRNDKGLIKRISEYCERYRELVSSVEEMVEEKYMKQYDKMARGKTAEVEAYLKVEKDKKKKEYLEQGYSEETLDTILNRTFSVEEVVAQDRRIRKNKLVDAVLKTEYCAFITIGDMLDAIVGGAFRSEQLLGEDAKIIPHGYGHGIAYYNSSDNNIFNETLANFALIFKSPESHEMLNYLKELVGEEYINFLFNYYKNEILLSNKYAPKNEQKEALA